jgi:hypothetical protein
LLGPSANTTTLALGGDDASDHNDQSIAEQLSKTNADKLAQRLLVANEVRTTEETYCTTLRSLVKVCMRLCIALIALTHMTLTIEPLCDAAAPNQTHGSL